MEVLSRGISKVAYSGFLDIVQQTVLEWHGFGERNRNLPGNFHLLLLIKILSDRIHKVSTYNVPLIVVEELLCVPSSPAVTIYSHRERLIQSGSKLQGLFILVIAEHIYSGLAVALFQSLLGILVVLIVVHPAENNTNRALTRPLKSLRIFRGIVFIGLQTENLVR